LSKSLHCVANERNLCRSDNPRRDDSKCALAFEPRAKFPLLALKSLDVFEQIAGCAL